VTTPGGVELNKKVVVFGKFIVEIIILQNEDVVFDFGSFDDGGCEGN